MRLCAWDMYVMQFDEFIDYQDEYSTWSNIMVARSYSRQSFADHQPGVRSQEAGLGNSQRRTNAMNR